MNTQELNASLNKLTQKERTVLRLIFESSFSSSTLLWLYRRRYQTLRNKIVTIIKELKDV